MIPTSTEMYILVVCIVILAAAAIVFHGWHLSLRNERDLDEIEADVLGQRAKDAEAYVLGCKCPTCLLRELEEMEAVLDEGIRIVIHAPEVE
jgi:hypothetical protein